MTAIHESLNETGKKIPRAERPTISITDLLQRNKLVEAGLNSAVKAALKELIKILIIECRKEVGRKAFEAAMADESAPSGVVSKEGKTSEEYAAEQRVALVNVANYLFCVLRDNDEYSKVGLLTLGAPYSLLITEINDALVLLNDRTKPKSE